MTDEAGYVLLTDQPATEGADPLGFDGLADRLAGLVLASRTSSPFAIGVLGGWGSGKSTLMGRLRTRLEGADDVETVWFNAWTAEGRSVLEGMIKSVLAEIGPGVLRRAMRRRKLVSGVRLAVTLALGWFGVGRFVDQVWEAFSADAKTRNELPGLLREAMTDWSTRRAGRSGRLLVVFVDDLDRCSPANVVEVFEAVKLYLDAPGFVFVIGYDDRMVSRALDREKEYDQRVAAQYLEKIVQMEYRMPRPDDRQSRALVDALVERSGTAALLGEAERVLVADRTQRNPRRVKRFLNSFVLARRLDPAAEEYPPREFILLRLLAMSFPAFYDLLVSSVERDAITEFQDYAMVHDWARRGRHADDDAVAAVFAGYGLTEVNPTPEASLERLGRSVPEPILASVDDPDLRALLRSFGTGPERAGMLERLRRLPPSVTAAPADDEPVGSSSAGPALHGVAVLWIDDNPANNLDELRDLRADGVTIATATTIGEALDLWDRVGPFDLVVSDIERHGDPDAGFVDLAELQRRTGWTGPAVFYAGRVTPDRRKRASALGATVGSSFAAVRGELARVVAARTRAD